MSEINENKISGGESSEYHYVRPEQNLRRRPDAAGERPSYVYSPSRGYSSYPPPKPAKKKRFGTRGVIALCLACVLLAGALGVGGTLLFTRSRQDDSADASVLTDPQTEQAEAPASTVTPVLVTNSTLDSNAMRPEDIYTLACQQVVGVTTEITYYNIFGQAGAAAVSGTGFILTDDGYVLTNYHVIEEAYLGGHAVSVLSYDGTEYAAAVVGVEADNDLAVLKIDAAGLSAAVLGDSNEMQVGQTIYTVGNPLGELSYTMTSGIVSAMDRSIRTDSNTTVNMFQIDAAVNTGNSGGPVYNAYGQVIGIVTAKYDSSGVEGLGFAIPISDAHFIANELITNGYVSGKATMGITPITVSSSSAQYYNMVQGAYVYSVDAGSCAEAAGLRTGDIIVAVGETEILDEDALVNTIKKYHAGDTAQLTVFRAQEYLELSITFDEELPEEEGTAEENVSISAGEIAPGQYYYQYEYQGSAQDLLEDFFRPWP